MSNTEVHQVEHSPPPRGISTRQLGRRILGQTTLSTERDTVSHERSSLSTYQTYLARCDYSHCRLVQVPGGRSKAYLVTAEEARRFIETGELPLLCTQEAIQPERSTSMQLSVSESYKIRRVLRLLRSGKGQRKRKETMDKLPKDYAGIVKLRSWVLLRWRLNLAKCFPGRIMKSVIEGDVVSRI